MSLQFYSRSRAKNATVSLAAAALITALSPVARGQGIPTLEPGSTFHFPATPNAVEGNCTPSGLGQCSVVTGETPLRAYAFGVLSGAKASGDIYQYHEFAVAESDVVGNESGNVLAAALSGTVNVNGFLFVMGGASASANIDLKVLDVTVDPLEPVLVWCGNVAEYGLRGFFSASVGGSVNVELEGGFPYIGASGGGGIDAGLGISPQLQIIQDEVDFGFGLLLQRGRTYRLQLELSLATQNRILAATAIASFHSQEGGAPVVPNAFDPTEGTTPGTQNTWLSILTKSSMGPPGASMMMPAPFGGIVNNYGMPKGDADIKAYTNPFGIDFNIWEQGISGLFNQISNPELGRMQRSDRFLAQLFGTQEGSAVTMSNLVGSDFVGARNAPMRDTIDSPGVQLSGLLLTIRNDSVELDQRETNRFIEKQLEEQKMTTSLYLPSRFGGELERVMALVDRLITNSENAGLRTTHARRTYDRAVVMVTEGLYIEAYRELCRAYRRLANQA